MPSHEEYVGAHVNFQRPQPHSPRPAEEDDLGVKTKSLGIGLAEIIWGGISLPIRTLRTVEVEVFRSNRCNLIRSVPRLWHY